MTRKHLSNETGVRIVLDFLPCFTFDSNHDETLGWKKHKLESRLPGDLNNLRYADDITLMAESKEELKSLLRKVKEKSEKAGLKLNIQKTKIMASSPITLWQREEEKVVAVTDFLSLDSKITEDGGCSHKIKRHLLLGIKAMTNLDSILKSRDITDKGPFSLSYSFSSSCTDV